MGFVATVAKHHKWFWWDSSVPPPMLYARG